MVKFQVHQTETTPFAHYWELCVGSCHAYTALREDYRSQLKKVHKELGFRYVRFHGLFDDDMSVCYRDRKTGEIVYNFVNIDNIFDFLLSIDMKPFVELGFMPNCLASGQKTCFYYKGNVTPPADYEKWKKFISYFTEHLLERYGIDEVRSWYFEVWNEPNLEYFFAGSQKDYFKLYEETARAIKSVSQELRVGGPSTSINAWIRDMIDYCEQNQIPLDFVSTHHYPTDDPLWKGTMGIEEFKSFNNSKNCYERGIMKKMARKAREEAGKYPLYYTEWNTSALPNDHYHDENYASAMIAKILADNDGLVDGYSYWTFTDIFEENGQRRGFFHGGFGLQTYAGVAKPVYRLFQIFHELGQERCRVESDKSEASVEMLAVKGTGELSLVIYNHNVPGADIKSEEVEIIVSDMHGEYDVLVYRIDENHVNPKAKWIAMREPEYPTAEQLERLQQASELQAEHVTIKDGKIQLTIMEHGVCCIKISYCTQLS